MSLPVISRPAGARRLPSMRLHSYAASANCLKVRVLLGLLAIDYEPVEVDIFAGDTLTDAFARLNPLRDIDRLVLVGTSVSRSEAAPIDAAAHLKTLVVHGEQDDTVALAAVFDWARPQALPVTVVPGGGHFFHGQLPLLKNLVVRHLSWSS